MNEQVSVWDTIIHFNIDVIKRAIETDYNDQQLNNMMVMGQSSWEFLSALRSKKIFFNNVDDSILKTNVNMILSNKNYIQTQRILRQEKYKSVQSIFLDKNDHSQFLCLLYVLENCALTQKLPFCVNQTLSEYANGNAYICSNLKCREEILLLDSESSEKYRNYCSVSDRYWCKKCERNLVYCYECSAIQWKPFAVPCMNDICQDEEIYLCQNKQCEYYKDHKTFCNICGKIVCGTFHEWNSEFDIVEVIHCIQCEELCCNQCAIICMACEKRICQKCVEEYELECKSTKCSRACRLINHPSCQKDCDCEKNQSEYCVNCIKHSCVEPDKIRMPRMTTGNSDQQCGPKCKICPSEK